MIYENIRTLNTENVYEYSQGQKQGSGSKIRASTDSSEFLKMFTKSLRRYVEPLSFNWSRDSKRIVNDAQNKLKVLDKVP